MQHPFPDLPLELPPSPAGLREIVQKQETLLTGHFLQVVQDTVQLPNGNHALREYVQHPGAVVIVPYLEATDRYVVEYQYRHPMRRAMIEFPAGKLHAEEPSLQCAQRELLEETGFVAKQWAFAGTLHNCIAYSDEHIDIWFARGLAFQQQCLDEGEFLQVYTATLPELLERARQGQLTDAKTLTALLWAQQLATRHWQLDWVSAPAHP